MLENKYTLFFYQGKEIMSLYISYTKKHQIARSVFRRSVVTHYIISDIKFRAPLPQPQSSL